MPDWTRPEGLIHPMLYRLGIFFVLIGLLLTVFGFLLREADSNFMPVCGAALISLAIGGFLMLRNRPQYSPTGRFRSINKFRERTTRKNE